MLAPLRILRHIAAMALIPAYRRAADDAAAQAKARAAKAHEECQQARVRLAWDAAYRAERCLRNGEAWAMHALEESMLEGLIKRDYRAEARRCRDAWEAGTEDAAAEQWFDQERQKHHEEMAAIVESGGFVEDDNDDLISSAAWADWLEQSAANAN